MILRSISDEANGGLQKGDRIIGIDNDDITTWTLARGLFNNIISLSFLFFY